MNEKKAFKKNIEIFLKLLRNMVFFIKKNLQLHPGISITAVK
jgi:hypothetical protein